MEPLTSYVVGWTAILVLALAIVALLCCLCIADPGRPCAKSRERVPWSQR